MNRKFWLKIAVILVIFFIGLRYYKVASKFRVIASFPTKKGVDVPLDSKIEIIFNQKVFPALVEKGFYVNPTIKGKFSWEGDQKMIFTPEQKLKRESSYKFGIKGLILSKKLAFLFDGYEAKFTSLGNPKIIIANPYNEAPDDMSPIRIVFDRPMLPLSMTTSSAVFQSPITIEPEIKGEGKWLGTSAYQFRPSERYRRATTYKVTVLKGLKSADGGTMKDGYQFQFSTLLPRVERVSPENHNFDANPTASIAAFLNQPIDPNSVEAHFDLFEFNNKNLKKIFGSLRIVDNVIGFYPDSALKRQTKYKAVIKSGLKGLEGPNTVLKDYEWIFTTVASPGITGSKPSNNDKKITNENNITVFFKTNMDEESFKNNFSIFPEPERKPTYSYWNKTLSIGTYLGRSAKYTVTINGSVKDQYGTPLGSNYSFSFETAPYKPSVFIKPYETYFATFNANVAPRIIAQVVNSSRLDFNLYKISRAQFIDLYSRRRGYNAHDPGYNNWQSYIPAENQKIKSWAENFSVDSNIPVDVVTKVTNTNNDRLAPGLYFLEVKIANGTKDNMVMIVSYNTLIVKRSDSQIFTWVVDQSNGATVNNMKIDLVDGIGTLLVSGVTNQDGVFSKDIDLSKDDDLLLFGQKDDDMIVALTNWNEGIAKYDFGLPYYYNEGKTKDWQKKESYQFYLTLDRSLYRPGQKIYFKGWAKKDNDGAYENLPSGTKVRVTLQNPKNQKLIDQDYSLSTFGTFDGSYILSKQTEVGEYNLIVTYDQNSYTQKISVEEYKKPEMVVSLSSSKENYLVGELINVDLKSNYYFGAPVVDGKVDYSVYMSDFFFNYPKDIRFEFGEQDNYWFYPQSSTSKTVTEGAGATNSKGEYNFTIPSDLSKYKSSQRVTVSGFINDISNQQAAGAEEVIIHKANYYVGIKPVSYIFKVNDDAKAEIIVVDTKGKEQKDIPVDVQFFRRTWETVKEQDPDDGIFYYKSVASDKLVSSTNVKSNEIGRAIASFKPEEGGTYRIKAVVADADGRQNSSTAYMWISGNGFIGERQNNDRILVIPDKSDYLVNEKSSVFVATPFATDSAKTLFTFERGKVIDYKIVDISDINNNIEFPIKSTYVPNTYIGATLIRSGSEIKKPAEFKIGYTEIKVTDPLKKLKISITTNKKNYRPKETLSAEILVVDANNKPVSAELAVALSDQAVWDISNNNIRNIYDNFYQERNLEVETSSTMVVSMDRINANTNLGAKGGSGGGGFGGQETLRTNFPDTAYWSASLKTDSNGKVKISVKLPDNLTTWRLSATGSTIKDAFGSTVVQTIVNRDVMMRPFLPRFLAVGDEANIGGIVVNSSGEKKKLSIKIEADGLKIKTENKNIIEIDDGEQSKIIWPAAALNVKSAKIKLIVTDESNKDLDAVEQTIPINSYSVPQVVATSGEIKTNATEKILLPKDIDPLQGYLKLSLNSSLGAPALNSINYLFDYPYFCNEQTTSRFFPALYIKQIMKSANLNNLVGIDINRIDFIVEDAIQRLGKSQNMNGGWGWWMEDVPDPRLSAYIYLGLNQAKKDGYKVPDDILTKAHNYLMRILSYKNNYSYENQIFIIYSLSFNNNSAKSMALDLFDRRFEVDYQARAQLATALYNFGYKGEAKQILNELVSLAKQSNTTVHWEGSESNNISAFVLEAMLKINPKHPFIIKTVRYLMSTLKDNYWSSTWDTAFITRAVALQLLQKDISEKDQFFKIDLNRKKIAEGNLNKKDLLTQFEKTIKITDLVAGKENKIDFARSGSGNLYYNMNLKYYLPFTEIKPLSNGFTIERELVDENGKTIEGQFFPENTEAWVRVTVVVPETRSHVIIEDYLPAGFEAINENLKNTSTLSFNVPKKPYTNHDLINYFTHKEFRDDRVVIFASTLYPGIYEFSYRVRSTVTGKFHQPPIQIYEMYLPDIMGHSSGGWMTVK